VFLPLLVPDQCAVRVIDVDGGSNPTTEPRTLATQPPNSAGVAAPRKLVDCVRLAAFAPAGGSVVYVGCDRSSRPPLRAIDLDTGRDRLLGRLEHFTPGVTHVNLAASPDGRTILFLGGVRRGGDLMLIENFR
jgi:hypothetical protein